MLPLFVASLLICSSVFLLQHDLNTLPKVPVPQDGRTWHLEEHGNVAYGTFGETARVYGLLMTGLVVGAFGVDHEKRMRSQAGARDRD